MIWNSAHLPYQNFLTCPHTAKRSTVKTENTRNVLQSSWLLPGHGALNEFPALLWTTAQPVQAGVLYGILYSRQDPSHQRFRCVWDTDTGTSLRSRASRGSSCWLLRGTRDKPPLAPSIVKPGPKHDDLLPEHYNQAGGGVGSHYPVEIWLGGLKQRTSTRTAPPACRDARGFGRSSSDRSGSLARLESWCASRGPDAATCQFWGQTALHRARQGPRHWNPGCPSVWIVLVIDVGRSFNGRYGACTTKEVF